MAQDKNKELENLYAKGQDELEHLKRSNTFKAKNSSRDVMVHIAVTIMGDQEGHHVIGETDNEIGQFAVRIPARWFRQGLTMAQSKRMFEELTHNAYERMRLYGLTRE